MKYFIPLLLSLFALTVSAQDVDMDTYQACLTGDNLLTCDCDDSDPIINPGSGNYGIVSCWPDVDGDTWGAIVAPISVCLTCPAGYVDRNGDCDDDDSGRHPGLVDDPASPNGIDEDCDCMPDNPTTPPANDEWPNAQLISIGSNVSGDTYTADLGSGNEDITYCGTEEKVVWYKFVATSTTHSIEFSFAQQHCNPPTSTALAILHTESSGTLTGVNCPGDLFQCFNYTGIHEYTCLVIGTTYYMSVGYGINAPYVSYTFAIDGASATVPLDDICEFQSSDLITLTPSSIVPKMYDLDGATTQMDESAPAEITSGNCDMSQNRWCDNELNGTIWIPIMLITSGKLVINTMNSVANRLALYDGITCNTTFERATLLTANDNLGGPANIIADCLEAGKMYWLQVDLEDGAASSMVDLVFDLQTESCSIQDPLVDVSCGAVSIATQESTGTGDWMHFYGDLTTTPGDDPSIIVSVNDMGQTLGTVSVNVQNHAGVNYRSYLTDTYLDRNFSISVDHQPTPGDSAHVRFYFPTDYINDFVSDQGLASLYEMILIKCTSIACICGDYIGIGEGFSVIGSGLLALGQITYLEFRVPEFSSFYFFDQDFDPCPTNRTVSQSIVDAFYQADQKITTSGTTTIDDNTIFIAGIEICLTEEFNVPMGKQFEAQINDCQN